MTGFTAPLPEGPGAIRRIGIVVPVFGHSRYVVEAIESACAQDIDIPFHVLAVDDGCPARETQQSLSACQRLHPHRFMSVRQRNGGLSAARNLGTRTLLALYPDLDAIFFLDSDNRLEPYALRAYADALEGDAEASWAFPDIHAFGLTPFSDGVDIRETAVADAPFLHLAGNISEAGSMVRAEVFRGGIAFDETMRAGLEDWDFWLSAREAGLFGTRVRDSGFLYRVRPESMVAQSRRETDRILAGMRRRHAGLFARRAVVAAEDAEAPRFLVVDLEDGAIRATSDPLSHGRRLTLRETAELFRAHLRNFNGAPFPATLVVHHGLSAAPAEWPLHMRSILFDALARPMHAPTVLQVEPSDHASRFTGDPRNVRKIADRGRAMLALIPVGELYRLAAERPRKPGLAVLRDTDWTEYWTVPIMEGPPAPTRKSRRRTQRLSALLRPILRAAGPPPLRPAGRLYRGPRAVDARRVTDELCGYGAFPPFPWLSPGRNCLVCVAPETLGSPACLQAFADFCERLAVAGLALTLQIDGQTRQPVYAEAMARARPRNVLLDPQPFRPDPSFSFMGSRLPVDDPASHDRQMAAMRAHDVVACFGLCRALALMGEAKGEGIVTLAAVPDALLDEAAARGADPVTTIAAYEHAHHILAVGERVRLALSVHGVPASRLVAEDRLGFAIRARLAAKG